jgi:hypothetical protein
MARGTGVEKFGSPKTGRMGHPFVLAVRRRTRTTADPYGMTTRKATTKARATADPL